jgi:hypothetical protein
MEDCPPGAGLASALPPARRQPPRPQGTLLPHPGPRSLSGSPTWDGGSARSPGRARWPLPRGATTARSVAPTCRRTGRPSALGSAARERASGPVRSCRRASRGWPGRSVRCLPWTTRTLASCGAPICGPPKRLERSAAVQDETAVFLTVRGRHHDAEGFRCTPRLSAAGRWTNGGPRTGSRRHLTDPATRSQRGNGLPRRTGSSDLGAGRSGGRRRGRPAEGGPEQHCRALLDSRGLRSAKFAVEQVLAFFLLSIHRPA